MSSPALLKPPQAGSLDKKSFINNLPENDITNANYTNENTNYTKNVLTNSTPKEKEDKCLIF
jgi:hypothetical protein